MCCVANSFLPHTQSVGSRKKQNIAVALDSSYEEIRCATHAPVRNASGEGPSECYFRSSPSAPRRETLLERNSMMAFQLSFSTSALKYRCKPKTNENDNVAVDLEKSSTSIRSLAEERLAEVKWGHHVNLARRWNETFQGRHRARNRSLAQEGHQADHREAAIIDLHQQLLGLPLVALVLVKAERVVQI